VTAQNVSVIKDVNSTYQIVDFFKVKRTHIPAIASNHFKIIENNLYSEFIMTPQNIYIIKNYHSVVAQARGM
jgi:hypothetical protein